MQTKLTVPGLGENIEHATVVRVGAEAGETLAAGQTILELEAGKATVEVPADQNGTVVQLLVAEGDEVDVGQPFAILETADNNADAHAHEEPEDEPAEPTPDQQDEEGGTPQDEPEPELPEEAPPLPAPPAPAPTGRVSPAHHVPAAPSVRRFAREIGIDVDTVQGSGPHGRVSKDDVKRHARDLNSRKAASMGAAAPPLPDFTKWGEVRTEPMSAIRKATAEHLSASWRMVPHVTHFDEADITNLEALRQRYKQRAADQGGKLTMAVMVCKAVAEALKKFPRFNASVDMDNRSIIFKESIHLGIAVATERGLLVPVIRNAGRKNMIELAAEIDRIAGACRKGKIQPAELEGGTFTITNLGSIGGSHFTPIINWPEVAILGLGRARPRVVVNQQGNVETRSILPLSLSYDHRVIDGADAARFVKWLAEAIEEPLLLSLEGVA